MSRKCFVFLFTIVLVLCVLISLVLPTRVLQKPDTALAWLGVLIAITIWTQQSLKLRGVSYYFRSDEERKKTDSSLVSNPRGAFGMIFSRAHWICLILMVFFFIQLLIGTIRDIVNEGDEIRKEDIQNLIKSNQKVVEQSQQNMRELIDRIDKLIAIMEAQNATENTTIK